MVIDKQNGKAAIYGGLLLGGGGGGQLEDGLQVLDMMLELGELEIVDINQFKDSDIFVTASLVGSPASKDKYVGIKNYDEVYKLFVSNYEKNISGIITNEIGAQSITNGWITAVKNKIPYIDAPCNGRAHPTGAMGSMKLSSNKDYISAQAASGGKLEKETNLFVKGHLNTVKSVISTASIVAGGFVTVLRNPVKLEYIKENAAIGAMEQAIKVGKIIIDNKDNLENMLTNLKELIGLEVVDQGKSENLNLSNKLGLDLGFIKIKGQKDEYTISILNEYIFLDSEKNGRIGEFPDLIAVFDVNTALPVTSANLKDDMDLIIVKIPKKNLKLGSSMSDNSCYIEVEEIMNKKFGGV